MKPAEIAFISVILACYLANFVIAPNPGYSGSSPNKNKPIVKDNVMQKIKNGWDEMLLSDISLEIIINKELECKFTLSPPFDYFKLNFLILVERSFDFSCKLNSIGKEINKETFFKMINLV
ncbi:hypothetical protein CHUAL_006340 [Chamberlinius hualienensis]